MAEQPAWTGGYELPAYPFVPPPELADGKRRRYGIVIVGGGLSGLTLACDLANRGVESLLLDEDDTIGVRGASSRGIVYAQKTLEVFAHLGTYPRIREKGITWSDGQDARRRRRRLLLQPGSRRARPSSRRSSICSSSTSSGSWSTASCELGRCDLRWKNRVTKVTQTRRVRHRRGRDARRRLHARGGVAHRRDRRELADPGRVRPGHRTPRASSTAGASPMSASRSTSRPSAGPGSRRRSTRTARCGSTSWATTSGGSTTRWRATATRST